MQYENRQPSEGVNVSRVHPLRRFLQLAASAIILAVLIVVLLQVSGSWLARLVPFQFELSVMQGLDINFGDNEDHPQMASYLDELAQRVASHMDLPEQMQIAVHYNRQDVFNAFATVGGNLMFYRALLKEMPNENTLAMVMAHEIAHVLHRDPVASLGGGVASTLALLALTGSSGSNVAGSVLGNASTITSVKFSKRMESSADEVALAALNSLYGHVNGAAALFEMFSAARGPQPQSSRLLEQFLSTHPLDADRIQAVTEQAVANGWQTDGRLTPLPDEFARWL